MTHPLKPPAWAKNFPDSTAKPSSLFNFTGTTASSTAAVRKVLTENDHGYDIFENPPRRCECVLFHLPLSFLVLGGRYSERLATRGVGS